MRSAMAAVRTLLMRGVRGRMSSELMGCAQRRNFCCATNIYKAGGIDKQPLRVTVVEGYGTGPVVCAAVRTIFKVASVPVEWDFQSLSVYRDHKTNQMAVNPELLNSATETGRVLRAQDTVVGQNNVQLSGTLLLNKALNAFLGVRRFKSFEGHEPYGPINMVNIRDNVSAEYSEIEHVVVPGVVQSVKTVSRKNSLVVAKRAFEYATRHGHKCITTLHKVNVMPQSDGVFMKACREVSASYPDVEYKEEKLDKFCLKVTTDPDRYGLLLTTSLYGALAGAVCATMSGGAATVPAAAYGPKAAVFSTMSDYGYGRCGLGNNMTLFDRSLIANPTGIIRAAAWMLRDAGHALTGRLIDEALENTVRQGVRTRDMNGDASCSKFTDTVVKNLVVLMGKCR